MDYIKGSGGIFRDCAVHDFDVVRWITGQEAVEVYATGSVQGDPLFTEYGDVDTAAIVVRFDGGALGVVSTPATTAAATTAAWRSTASTTPSWPAGIRVPRCETWIPPTTSRPGPPHNFFMDRFTEAFRTELGGFVDVVKGGPVQGATVADAVEVAWIAEAATESLRRGVPVRIEEVRKDEQQ